MFNPSQYSTHFTYQSNTIFPNTDQFCYFPPPAPPSVPSSDQPLHPPGTDPYYISGTYPPTHVAFQAQTPFGDDPNAGSHSWAVTQPQPIAYEASIKSLNESLLVATTTANSLWDSNWTNQHFANNAAIQNIPQPTDGIQSMRCDICNVNCTSKAIYEAHVLGKKHQRNLKMQYNLPAAVLPSQTSSVGGQVIVGSSGVAAGAELETKRRKILSGGAAVDSTRVCTICNITCSSEEVYNKHLYGKRHKAQASLMSVDGGPYLAAVRSQFNGSWKKDPNKTKLVQSAWCEICKINCNSNDAYIKHLVGKKHQKNLEQLGKPKNDGSTSTSSVPLTATNTLIGPLEIPGATSLKGSQPQAPPEEDLETKKRKVISEGAAASAVRTCAVCNVVCNSQAVFNYHLAGQKHAAMVKKQAEAGVTNLNSAKTKASL